MCYIIIQWTRVLRKVPAAVPDTMVAIIGVRVVKLIRASALNRSPSSAIAFKHR